MKKRRSKNRPPKAVEKESKKKSYFKSFLDVLQTLWEGNWSDQDYGQDETIFQTTNKRIKYTAVFLVICFGSVLLKASTLMLFDDPRLAAKAREQFDASETIQGRRGDLLDRNGEKLATSVSLFNIILDPSMIANQDIPDVIDAIASVATIDKSLLSKRILKRKKSRYLRVLSAGSSSPARITSADVPLLRLPLNESFNHLKKEYKHVEDETKKQVLKSRIKEYRSSKNSIFFEEREYRYYPDRDTGAPLLGLVRQTQSKLVGASGTERLYERWLRGDIFRVVRQRDRRNNALSDPDSDLRIPEEYHGKSVTLTIDRRIQHITDRAVKEALELTEASAAYAVVLDVETGGIIAMSSQPTQNLNDTVSIDINLLRNHAALSLYEPGSVMKPFVAAAVLNEDRYTPESLINCENGRWRVPGKTITDEHGKGIISVTEIIQYSSNIGAAKMAFELGADLTLGYVREFGFGRKSGLKFYSEPRGSVADPNTVRPVELATTSYGYGINATILQIASAYSTLANKGTRMQPMLVREVKSASGELVHSFEPQIDRQVIRPEVADQVLQMMVQVVEDGTAKRAKVPGYYVAGKTGTAKKLKQDGSGYSETERIGSFAGIIPADKPKLAIVVTVDNPTKGVKFGGVVAAPAFAKIALESMKTLGIKPNPELAGISDSSSQNTSESAIQKEEIELIMTSHNQVLLPDLSGLSLRDTMNTLSKANLKISIIGSGVVHEQLPIAGTLLEPGALVEVHLN